jgi:phosphatidylinositol alpha 1,6-mannosyltransferase
MIQSTHLRIAMNITEQWDDSMRQMASVEAFIDGSTLPDRSLFLRIMTHGFPKSGRYVFSLLSSLVHDSLTPEQFGRRLGIVAHLLTDYACSYHSNPKLKNRIFGHRAYERTIDALPLPPALEEPFELTSLSALWSELEHYVQTRHAANLPSLPEHDLSDALFLVSRVSELVFEAAFAMEKNPNPFSVAIFADTFYPHVNGVSNTIRRYSLHMTKQSIPHLLIVPSCKERSLDMEEGVSLLRIKSVSFPFYRGAMVALPNKRRINAVLDLMRPSVIHAMTEFVLGSYGKRYAKKHDIPFVSNYSTHYHMGIKHYKIGLVGTPLMNYLDRFHQTSDLTTAPSVHALEYLSKHGVAQPFLFGRGVDTTQFSPARKSAAMRKLWHAEDHFVFLYVGRLAGEKDLDVLMESYHRLSIVERSLCRLVLVGDGPERKRLETQYPDAIFMGTLSKTRLWEAYASADCFVFPSPSETLGNVVLEAMASGLPVLAVKEGGVLDNIVDGVNGLLVPPKDINAFRDGMRLLFFGDGTRKRLAQNGLRHAQSRSWEEVFDNMIRRYQTLQKSPLVPQWYEDALTCRIEHAQS